METRVSPLPSQTLVLNFLELYTKTRESSNNTTTHLAVSGINRLYSYVTRTDPVDEALKKIVDDVKDLIESAGEWIEWYNLIFILRVKAEEAQAQKTNKEEDSLLRETLHAMACLIVSELKNCCFEEGCEEERKNTLIDKRIKELKDKVKIKNDDQTNCLHTKKGNGCIEAFNKEKKYLKELTYLCDLDSAWKLEKYDLLKNYKCLANNSKAVPPYFLSDYHEMVYSHRYQKITTISLTEFKESALKQEKEEIDKKIKRKNEELDQLKQMKLSENEEFKKNKELEQIQSEINLLKTELAKSENENQKITFQKRLDSILQALNPILPEKTVLPGMPMSEPGEMSIPQSPAASTLDQVGVFAQKPKLNLNNAILESYLKEKPSREENVSQVPKSKM